MGQSNIGLLDLWRSLGNTGDLPAGWTGPGGGGGGGYQPLSAPDVATLRENVYKTLQPYYLQLAKEAQGDFDRAAKILQEDYVKGVREQRVEFEFTKKKQWEEIDNSLRTLGLAGLREQEGLVDDLNKRGMAVYQNNPDGSYNVLKPSDINTTLSPDERAITTTTITNPTNPNMGRGGQELARLQQEQRLRAEAQARASAKPIEEAGIKLRQYTSLPAGVDPNTPPDQLGKMLAAPGTDRSKLGSAELNLIRGTEQKTRELQQTQQDLAERRSADISNTVAPLAATGTKALGSQMEQQLQRERQTQFINAGT